MSKIDLEPLVCLKRARMDVERGNCEYNVTDYLDTIEDYILKTQKLEKESAYIEKIKTMLKQKDCILRYVESEDCFAVKTILSYDWYKITPEFVDNNVREEVKPLPLIQKNVQLREENAKYKKVLEIIKEKDVDIKLLKECEEVEEYNAHFIIDEYQELTEEEFSLLKSYFGEKKEVFA